MGAKVSAELGVFPTSRRCTAKPAHETPPIAHLLWLGMPFACIAITRRVQVHSCTHMFVEYIVCVEEGRNW